MSNSPYQDLDPRAYWRTGVSQRSPLEPGDLYHPKFPIRKRKSIATTGSCFAQHIGRNLRQVGFNVIDGEPLHKDFPDELAAKCGLTKKSYSEGPFRMDDNTMETNEEHIHMNAEFGKLMLEKYFTQIDCATAK